MYNNLVSSEVEQLMAYIAVGYGGDVALNANKRRDTKSICFQPGDLVD